MVGETVLLKIAEGVLRPLLVVAWDKGSGAVAGELFVNVDDDRGGEWLRENVFNPVWSQQRTVWVRDLKEGHKVGQWQKRQTPGSVLTPKPLPTGGRR